MYENYLAHYGVLGMRWGRRKGKSTKSSSKRQKKKKVSQMSNEELRERINRMQLEQQYKSLNHTNRNAALKYVGRVMSNTGNSIVNEYTTKYAKKGIKLLGDYVKKQVVG